MPHSQEFLVETEFSSDEHCKVQPKRAGNSFLRNFLSERREKDARQKCGKSRDERKTEGSLPFERLNRREHIYSAFQADAMDTIFLQMGFYGACGTANTLFYSDRCKLTFCAIVSGASVIQDLRLMETLVMFRRVPLKVYVC